MMLLLASLSAPSITPPRGLPLLLQPQTSATPTADEIAAAVWSYILEGALTAEQMQRVMLAALAGKRSGLGTAVENYMGQDGITPRVIFTPSDANGNGTTVVDGV